MRALLLINQCIDYELHAVHSIAAYHGRVPMCTQCKVFHKIFT